MISGLCHKKRESTREAYCCVILAITSPAWQLTGFTLPWESCLSMYLKLSGVGVARRKKPRPICHLSPHNSLIILWPLGTPSSALLRRSGLFTWRLIRHSISINNAIWQILYNAEYEVSLTATNKWGNGWCDKAWEGDRERRIKGVAVHFTWSYFSIWQI